MVADRLDLANRIADDMVGSLDRLLPAGAGVVEARFGGALQQVLIERGWTADEPWTPLRRDLTRPIPPARLQVEVVGPELIEDRVTVHTAAFPGSTFSVDRWLQMTDGYAYRSAECLVGYNDDEVPVAATTVWSAGPGRPGLIEPLGVHADHRGRGYGVAMTLAAADAMRRMGCSSATVATPSSNTAAVATYQAAGLAPLGEVTDFRRP